MSSEVSVVNNPDDVQRSISIILFNVGFIFKKELVLSTSLFAKLNEVYYQCSPIIYMIYCDIKLQK